MAYRRHGDSLRAPCKTPFRCKNRQSPHHLVEIIKRFPHTHKYQIRQFIAILHRKNLINYFGRRQATLKTLFSGHAKTAIHLAAHLRRHTQSSPVAIGNINRFHKIIASYPKKIFYRSIGRTKRLNRSLPAYIIALRQ